MGGQLTVLNIGVYTGLLFYRQVIESEMKDTKVDMKPVFFDALAKNSVIPEQEISVESLGRCYGPMQKQV